MTAINTFLIYFGGLLITEAGIAQKNATQYTV
jgi:hypothetical protein